jgi:hypothetical protein
MLFNDRIWIYGIGDDSFWMRVLIYDIFLYILNFIIIEEYYYKLHIEIFIYGYINYKISSNNHPLLIPFDKNYALNFSNFFNFYSDVAYLT